MASNLIIADQVTKAFKKHGKDKLLVLENVNFSLKRGEIVAILGKSGSGKSTFLRILAGLIGPSSGNVCYDNEPVYEPVPGIAMVFQSFALMPWLTVLENVELGLEALKVPRHERRQRALKAIDTIGLDGFESAYPKELSGGMRQRVGFARALVVEPEVLLMDEPFSALDILTAENLRGDLLDLWQGRQTKIQGIICVTHDIEEAILIADRIIIFDNDPGRIKAEIAVTLKHPRDKECPDFKKLLNRIYLAMTTSERARVEQQRIWPTIEEHPEYGYRVPEVDISELTGLMEALADEEKDGQIDLPSVAESLHLDVNNIFPLTEVLDMLRFAKIDAGKLTFTPAGRTFANADILERKQIFAKHLITYIPLAKLIRTTLDTAPANRENEEVFLEELRQHFTNEEAERILKTIIDWGRYAELFAYDYDASELSLENPQ